MDLNVPTLLASFEAAASNGHKAKSDVLPEQLLTAVPGSKL